MVWPDPALGPLCSVDRRFPLPGNVGVLHEGQEEAVRQVAGEEVYSYVDPVSTLPFQQEERHFSVLAHYMTQDAQVSCLSSVFSLQPQSELTVDKIRSSCVQLTLVFFCIFS